MSPATTCVSGRADDVPNGNMDNRRDTISAICQCCGGVMIIAVIAAEAVIRYAKQNTSKIALCGDCTALVHSRSRRRT